MNRTWVSVATCLVLALAVQVASAEAGHRWRRRQFYGNPVAVAPAPPASSQFYGWDPYGRDAGQPLPPHLLDCNQVPAVVVPTVYNPYECDRGPELEPPHPCDDGMNVPDNGRPSYQYSQYYGAW